MRVLAFDLSLTASGVAVGEDGKITGFGLITGKHDGVERLIYNRNRIADKVDAVKPDLVIFEDLSYGSADGKAFERAGLAFMVRAELVTDKIPWVTCSPMGLKKFVCGSAGSSKAPMKKEHMLKFLATRFGHDVNDNNICDAIGLAYLGMALVGDWEPTIEPQRAVLAVVRKNHAEVLKRFPLPESIQSGQQELAAISDGW